MQLVCILLCCQLSFDMSVGACNPVNHTAICDTSSAASLHAVLQSDKLLKSGNVSMMEDSTTKSRHRQLCGTVFAGLLS